MKPKLSSPYSPFIRHRMNYMTTIQCPNITAEQYNRFIDSLITIKKTDGYHIQVESTMNQQELYAVCCALVGKPKNGVKNKTSDNHPGIELKYGGTLGNKDSRDKAFDELSRIIAYGKVVRADSTEHNYAYSANGQGFRFAGDVSSAVNAAASASSGNSSLLSTLAATKSSGSGSTTTYLLLAAAAIAVILIIKKKKKNG